MASFYYLLLHCLLLFIYFFFTSRIIGITPSGIQISSTGTNILFTSSIDNHEEYLILVHPQGWQETMIEIKKGNLLKFKASGQINVSLNGLSSIVELRYDYERKLLGKNDESNHPPEDFFTKNQRDSLKLKYPWIGPEGFSDDSSGLGGQRYPGRIEKKILPTKPLGALLVAIKYDPHDPMPDSSNSIILFIGKEFTHRAEKDGKLWFIINDVWHKQYPNMFYSDNIGLFLVNVSVGG